MEYRWIKEFFISYIGEMFIKLLIILIFIYWLFFNLPLLIAMKFRWFAANISKSLEICREAWSAATKDAYSERASYAYLIKLEQYEREKE